MSHRTLAALLILLSATGLTAQRRGAGGGSSMPQSAMVLHGSVVLPDGVVPHRIIRLEEVCGGRSSGLAFTDSKGHYSFNLGIVYNPLTGAAAPGGNTIANFANCGIRATLEGFRAPAIPIGQTLKNHETDLPRILLQPVAKNQNVILSATDAAIGPLAKKDYDRALDLVAIGKWKDAIKAMQKTVAEEPKFATAWLSLGMLQVSEKQDADAVKSFTSAIAADENFAPPCVELAVVEVGSQDWEKVAEHSAKAIALDAESFPRAWYLNAMANFRLKKMDAALKSSAEGVRVDQDHQYPDLQYMYGVLLASSGDRTHGRQQLESYLDVAPNGDNADNARAQLKAITGAK